MRIAFFDVDQTLIGVKSMFDFLAFRAAADGEPPATARRLTEDLHAQAASGVPREEVNRRYYRLFAGHDATRTAELGRRWFAGLVDPFLPGTLAALRAHQAAGDLVVLLSGSFAPCLDPLAAALDVHWVLGTRPVVRAGRYTGEVRVPMIGAAKAAAARAVAAVCGADLRSAHAYGDDVSDIPLLEAVGHPVAVAAHPDLAAHAARRGWAAVTGRDVLALQGRS